MTKTELHPTNGRKSFYGKAIVEDYGNGHKRLLSYDTPVCVIKDGEAKLLKDWDYSNTTVIHVRTFLETNGFYAGSKAEIGKTYKRASK